MNKIKYADAGMDMKKWMLLLLRQCRIVLAAAVIGAALGGIIYTIARTVPESEREYQAISKVYLDFAADETGQVYQEYNGYTWNDLMVTDPILDATMSYLPEEYTREEVMTATEATILSDLRLLTVTITTNQKERTDTILAATDRALEEYGSNAKEFMQITVIQTTQAELVVADSRLVQAVLIGIVIALAVTLLGMLLYYVLDDRILVASDVKQVTDVSFIGYVFEKNERETMSKEEADIAEGAVPEKLPGLEKGQFLSKQALQNDYDRAVAYLRENCGEVLKISVPQGEDASSDIFTKAREADGVILSVLYGKMHGTYLAYLIGQYQAQGCNVLGIAIENADMKFLQRYYGRAIGKVRAKRK